LKQARPAKEVDHKRQDAIDEGGKADESRGSFGWGGVGYRGPVEGAG